MKPNTYKILQEAVENGIELGYNRAYKHSDTPSEATGILVKQQIYDAVMNEISKWFIFEDVGE